MKTHEIPTDYEFEKQIPVGESISYNRLSKNNTKEKLNCPAKADSKSFL